AVGGVMAMIPLFSRENVLQNAVRPPLFVPETVCGDALFRQMKQTGERLAVVLDEYGGVQGILTRNDLIEQLVGDLEETPENGEAPELLPLVDGTFAVRGTAPLREVAEALGVELPTGDFDTFGGFVFDRYGHVPSDGSVFTLDTDGLHIEVTAVEEHRLESATVRVTEQAEK
ncbi:MAG: CBS domain-containing protein, partial [Clostridia bacterium]|nr:CBS domain-containing protein [Clostridia bacterium]